MFLRCFGLSVRLYFLRRTCWIAFRVGLFLFLGEEGVLSGYLDLLSQVESAEKALVLLESFEVFLEEKQDQVSDRIELAILALSELKTELGLARLIDLCNTPCSVYRVR